MVDQSSLFPVYSVSQLLTYLDCPRKYKFKYVDGISEQKSTFVIFGTCTHQALQHNYLQKIHSHEDLHISRVVDVFVENLEKYKHEVDWEGKFGEEKDVGMKLLKTYFPSYSRKIIPAAVEQEITFSLPEVDKPWKGYIDLVSIDPGIYEFKTINRTPSDLDTKKNLFQLSAYAYALKKEQNTTNFLSQEMITKVANTGQLSTFIQYFVKSKTDPRIVQVKVERREQDTQRFINLSRSIITAIEQKVFPPMVTSWKCSPRFCSFWSLCSQEFGRDSFFK